MERGVRPRERWMRVILVWMICVTAISPSFAFGPGYRPELFVASVALSPLLFLFKSSRRLLPRIDIPSAILILAFIPATLLFHPGTIRWGSALFGCACLCFFMGFARIAVSARTTAKSAARILKIIIFLFAGCLLIQQLCVLTGLPVFNPGRPYQNPWKLGSLTSEPTYSTFTVCLLLFFYFLFRRQSNPDYGVQDSVKKDWAVWLSAGWTCFSTPNATAYLLFPLPFIALLNRKNALTGICSLILIVGCGVGVATRLGVYQAERALNAVKAYISLSEEEIVKNEWSSGMRPLPTLEVLRATDSSISSLLTGHGADAEKQAYSENVKEVIIHPVTRIWFDYGLPAQLALWYLVFHVCFCHRRKATIVVMLLGLLYSGGTSDQSFWLIMLLSWLFQATVKREATPDNYSSGDESKGQSNPPRILATQLLDDRSGSAIVLSTLLPELARLGHSIKVISSGKGPIEDSIKEIEENQPDAKATYTCVPYRFVGKGWKGLWTFSLAQWRHSLQTFRFRKDYDILYCNTILPVGSAIAAFACGKRIICHCHENPRKKGLGYRMMWFLMRNLSECVVCVSKDQASSLPGNVSKEVVENPVSGTYLTLSKEKGGIKAKNGNSRPHILMASSLRKYKGIDNFIRLAKAMPDADFTFASTVSEEEFRNFAEELGLSLPGNLRYVEGDSIQKMSAVYSEATMIVNLSDPKEFQETFGMTIAEGGIFGLPAIVPREGGIAERVKEGKNGYHIPGSDQPALAEAIRRIHATEATYARYSVAARQRAQSNTPAAAARKIAKLQCG